VAFWQKVTCIHCQNGKVAGYRVAKRHRTPWLQRSLSEKEPYYDSFFCGKSPAKYSILCIVATLNILTSMYWPAGCRSPSVKEPSIIIGLFCKKRALKIRHPMPLCHPVHIDSDVQPFIEQPFIEYVCIYIQIYVHIHIHIYMSTRIYESICEGCMWRIGARYSPVLKWIYTYVHMHVYIVSIMHIKMHA